MEVAKYISGILWTLPSPNEAWAKIIESLAWPILVLFLVLRFRDFIKVCLNTLLDRLKRDHVKLGGILELTPHDQLVPLTSDGADGRQGRLIPDDEQIIEEIFEFIAEEANLEAMIKWVIDELPELKDIWDFFTEPQYANLRSKVYDELIRRSA